MEPLLQFNDKAMFQQRTNFLIEILSDAKAIDELKKHKYSAQNSYFAMYSSWLGGITKNPNLMVVPVDDHMVHRGDGVFEAIKAVNGKPYLLDDHCSRLLKSADAISIKHQYGKEDLKEIITKTLNASDQTNALIRVFLSRGPGNFSTNPYDSISAQLYVIITELKQPSLEKYKSGLKAGMSKVPVKDSWLAQVKSCNYLPNVMMKKESVDRGLDITVAFDDEGFLAESSTENVFWINQAGVVCHPPLNNILKGTTMTRLFDLLEKKNLMKTNRSEKSTIQDLMKTKALFVAGTTWDIIPISEFEGQKFAVPAEAQIFLDLVRGDQA